MSLHVNTFLSLFLFFAQSEQQERPFIDNRQAIRRLKIFKKPSLTGRSLGGVRKGDVFEVFEELGPNRRCKTSVGRVDRGGYVCLRHTKSVDVAPNLDMPPLLSFHPPTAEDKKTKDYRKKRIWPDLQDPSRVKPFMPSIHATVKQPLKSLYANVAAYENRSKKRYDLPLERTYAFANAIETKRGWVLEREDGKVIPIEKVNLHAIDRFEGRDMVADPAPSRLVPAFIRRKRSRIYSEPSVRSPLIRKGVYRETFNVEPALEKGFVVARNIDGNGASGYIRPKDIRYWREKPRPLYVGDDEVWVDVVLSQQLLTLYRGDLPLMTTLVSTGKRGHSTPTGLFNIRVKYSHDSMSNYLEEEEKWEYYIEDVPFVMYFYKGYALHSAFWHGGYGTVRSHGCVNLSVKDVKKIFDAVTPTLPKGWRAVKSTSNHRGSVVRVRVADEDVPDRRLKINRVSITDEEVREGLSERSDSD